MSEVSRLERTVQNLKRALRDERQKGAAVRQLLGAETMSEALERVQEITSAMDEWDGLMDELEQRRDQEGELLGQAHYDAFERVATELGVDPADVPDLWQLTDYTAEGMPDPEHIRDILTEARQVRPRYFPAEESNGSTPARDASGVNGAPNPSPEARGGALPTGTSTTPALSRQPLTGLGGGRGVTNGSTGRFTVRKSETRDPAWMKQHGQNYLAAMKDGTLDFRDNE